MWKLSSLNKKVVTHRGPCYSALSRTVITVTLRCSGQRSALTFPNSGVSDSVQLKFTLSRTVKNTNTFFLPTLLWKLWQYCIVYNVYCHIWIHFGFYLKSTHKNRILTNPDFPPFMCMCNCVCCKEGIKRRLFIEIPNLTRRCPG